MRIGLCCVKIMGNQINTQQFCDCLLSLFKMESTLAPNISTSNSDKAKLQDLLNDYFDNDNSDAGDESSAGSENESDGGDETDCENVPSSSVDMKASDYEAAMEYANSAGKILTGDSSTELEKSTKFR